MFGALNTGGSAAQGTGDMAGAAESCLLVLEHPEGLGFQTESRVSNGRS